MTQIRRIVENKTIIEYAKSNIYIIEDILEDSFCDELRQLIDTLPLTKIVHSTGNNVECNISRIDELLNINDELYYEFSTDTNKYNELLQNIQNKKSIYTNKLNGLMVNSMKEYHSKINDIMINIQTIMNDINPRITLDHNSGYLLRKIYGRTRKHIDNISELYDSNINFIKNNKKGDYRMVRSASIIFGLNDDYDGGMYNFPYYDVTLKLKKGSVIIFPPYWTHEHEVFTVENNTFRYTLSTWSCMNI
jgi:hypothetical protein